MYLDKILGSRTKINLLYTLVSNPDREFSELELAKLSNVSASEANRQVKDLVESGLVTMSRYGKTKVYRINKKHFLHKPLRKLFTDLWKIYRKAAEDLVRHLVKRYKVSSVILFGSVARGDIREDFTKNPSDIDIVTICKRGKRKIKEWLIKFVNSLILAKYGFVAYPIVLTEREYLSGLKSDGFIIKVHAEGEVIYGKKPKRFG